jgi:hypothetical protein
MSRFDYVKYGEAHTHMQARGMEICTLLETFIDTIPVGRHTIRAKSLALTNLEQTYMWIGKAIRDNQVAAAGESVNVAERG